MTASRSGAIGAITILRSDRGPRVHFLPSAVLPDRNHRPISGCGRGVGSRAVSALEDQPRPVLIFHGDNGKLEPSASVLDEILAAT